MRDYQTKQRRLLQEFFLNNQNRKVTLEDMRKELSPDSDISRSAIYRNLDRMVEEGLLVRTREGKDRRTFYQYVACGRSCDRVHLRCETCGRLMHLQTREDEERLTDILKANGFLLDGHATTIYGICRNCSQ